MQAELYSAEQFFLYFNQFTYTISHNPDVFTNKFAFCISYSCPHCTPNGNSKCVTKCASDRCADAISDPHMPIR